METNSLISILVALLVILLVTLLILLFVVTFVFISRRIKSNNKELKVVEVVPNNDFNYLKETIGDYLLSKKEISQALDTIIEHHGEIPEKIGKKLSPIFDEYVEILHTICQHPETDDALVLDFERNLSSLNPTYRRDIIEAIFMGLNLKKVTY